MQHVVSVEPRLCFFIVINLDLFVNREHSLTTLRIIMRTEQPMFAPHPLGEGEVAGVKLVLIPSNSLLTVPRRWF